MGDRTDESERDDLYRSSAWEWVLLEGDRLAIAVPVAAAFGTALLTLEWIGVAPIADLQPLYYAFSGLIAGNLTLITVVVSINQLLLSRELKSPGELRSDIDDTVDYRSVVESITGRAAPAEPSGFLRLVVDAARRDAQRLGGAGRASLPPEMAEELDPIVTSLTDHFDRIDGVIDESDPGVFNVLATTLETNFAYQISHLDAFRRDHRDELDEGMVDAIEALLEGLRKFDVARQYFKVVYLRVELSALSRRLFYAGLPALGVSVAALFAMTAARGAALSRTGQVLFFPAAIAIGVLPVAILFAYVLRTATVSERTAAITPFTTPEQES